MELDCVFFLIDKQPPPERSLTHKFEEQSKRDTAGQRPRDAEERVLLTMQWRVSTVARVVVMLLQRRERASVI